MFLIHFIFFTSCGQRITSSFTSFFHFLGQSPITSIFTSTYSNSFLLSAA